LYENKAQINEVIGKHMSEYKKPSTMPFISTKHGLDCKIIEKQGKDTPNQPGAS